MARIRSIPSPAPSAKLARAMVNDRPSAGALDDVGCQAGTPAEPDPYAVDLAGRPEDPSSAMRRASELGPRPDAGAAARLAWGSARASSHAWGRGASVPGAFQLRRNHVTGVHWWRADVGLALASASAPRVRV